MRKVRLKRGFGVARDGATTQGTRNMSQAFNSPIFGETRHGSDDERAQIAKAVAETPVTVFQELNKKFNERGLCISIMSKEEMQ